jgi:acetyltransferase
METRFVPRDVELRNGRSVHLRAIVPSDEEELLQAFDRLGAEARYMRFMRVVRAVDLERLRGVLDAFPKRGLAIAATVPAADGIDIAGSATYIIGPTPDTCEFAVSVTDAWAGAGLGRVLMDALIGAARRRGLRTMEGFVLAENDAMLRLALRLGFAVTRHPEDFNLKVCRLQLRGEA